MALKKDGSRNQGDREVSLKFVNFFMEQKAAVVPLFVVEKTDGKI